MSEENQNKEISYQATPTISKFHKSNAMVRGLMGPLGSGKSVGCCIEILQRSLAQAPSSDGVRRTRWAVVRNTYSQLKTTTIKTWEQWIPKEICKISMSPPIKGVMEQGPLPDGTYVEMEVYFISLDKPQDVGKVLSFELTGAWVNEARELPFEIVKAIYSRTARYPSPSDTPDGITWTGMIMDTNPPSTDHWWYKAAEKGDDELKKSILQGDEEDDRDYSWQFFRQPAAILPETNSEGKITGYVANPKAENVKNHALGYKYWMRYVGEYDAEWIKVHCCSEYGSIFDGKPVYLGSYNDLFHVAKRPLGVFRKEPLHLGIDFGLTPACIIGQISPNGQLRILRELICQRGGIKQFTENVIKPTLAQLFPGMHVIATGDPAGMQGSQADELTCFDALASCGIPASPAPTNVFLQRRSAVINRLNRIADGQPGFLLDPSCKMLRDGFIGGYHFRRLQVTGSEGMFKEEPAKNKYSHPHDALQYLILGADTVVVEKAKTPAPPPPPPSWAGFV